MAGEVTFEEFVAARQASLLRSARLLTGDWAAAQDLVQAALLRTWPRWDRVRDQQPDAYVRKIMVNLSISRWRSAARELRRQTLASHRAQPSDVSDTVTGRADMDALLQALPVRQRATIVLRYYEDRSERETAAILGCSVGTVKSQTSKALARLRIEIGDAAPSSPIAQPPLEVGDHR